MASRVFNPAADPNNNYDQQEVGGNPWNPAASTGLLSNFNYTHPRASVPGMIQKGFQPAENPEFPQTPSRHPEQFAPLGSTK